MLKILLESFLLDCAELNKDADKEINYLYETLESSFLSDLQKLIKESNLGIQELKLLAYQIITSEEFKEELSDLYITIEENTTVGLHLEDAKTFLDTYKKTNKEKFLNYAKDSYRRYKAEGGKEVIQELEDQDPIKSVYNEVINSLMANDRNATYNEILSDHNGNYINAIYELLDCLESLYSEADELQDFYSQLCNKIYSVI